MPRLLPFLFAPMVAALPAFADQPCHIPGFVLDSVPGNPVVYDAPADGAMDLGALPMVNDPDQGRIGPNLIVGDVQNGYAYVSQIQLPAQAQTPANPIPDGWVLVADLGFTAQTSKGFVAADPASDVLWQGDTGLNADDIASLTACNGDWVAARLHANPETPIWLRGFCGANGPACDAVQGD